VDSNPGTTSIKLIKNVNGIRPSYVEVWEYLCNRRSSNDCSSFHRIWKLAKIIFSYQKPLPVLWMFNKIIIST